MWSFLHRFSLDAHSTGIAFLIGAGGVLLFFLYRRGGFLPPRPRPHRPRRPPVLRGISASDRPAVSAQQAATHIQRNELSTLGELVHFFRGDGLRQIGIDSKLCAYLTQTLDATETDPGMAWHHPLVRRMMRQLLQCTETAARMEAERATAFQEDNAAHAQLLRDLWLASGRPEGAFSRQSEEWNRLGFQGLDPVTDLRGGGVLALRQLTHFAQIHPNAFGEMMAFNRHILAAGEHCWYLPAVVSIQFTAQLLLREFEMHLPQLETLYDTLKQGEGGARATRALALLQTNATEAKAPTKGAAEGGVGAEVEQLWENPSDFEAGLFTLHHQLLLHFKECWHRDRPHVMSFGTYMPSVFKTFFIPEG